LAKHLQYCSNAPNISSKKRRKYTNILQISSNSSQHPEYIPVGLATQTLLDSVGEVLDNTSEQRADVFGLSDHYIYNDVELDERAEEILVEGNRVPFAPVVVPVVINPSIGSSVHLPTNTSLVSHDIFTDDDTIIDRLPDEHPMAIICIWEKQKRMDEIFSAVGAERRFALRNGANWEKLVTAFDFGITVQLSEVHGDLFLNLLSEWSDLQRQSNLPGNWHSAKEAIDRVLCPLSAINFAEFKWPEELFGTVDESGAPLKPIRVQYLDLAMRIAEHLWDIDPKNIRLKKRTSTASFPVKTSSTTTEIFNDVRIFDGYDSGVVFERHSNAVQIKHGSNSVVINIAFSTDKSQKNQTGSRVGKPLIMLITNCEGKSFHISVDKKRDRVFIFDI
jgi:hypothetical protein